MRSVTVWMVVGAPSPLVAKACPTTLRDFAPRRRGLHFFLEVVPEQPGAAVIVFYFHDGVVS